ncbi:MAG: molecular chaperone HtpG [Saprospiraceae bacterium]|nr:molecular chaperone HtpG [Saprospiraceae bacterium]
MHKTGQIGVSAEDIFPLIKKFLYTDQEIFLRELIANAIDATTKLNALATKGEIKEELGDLTIDVILDENEKTITIRDNGIGMTEEEVIKYLNQLAFSSAKDFLEKYSGENLIGHFGLGFYSSFMVSEKVEVKTRSYQENAVPVKWECDGTPEYNLDQIEKETRGTDIVLHVNEDGKDYLKKERIQELLDKYCKFMPVPIRFGTKKTYETEGEGEDAKSTEKEVDNIINNSDPLWKKSPSDIKDEEYKDFYHDLFPGYFNDPVFWIHLKMDYPFNLNGILYFPKLTNNFDAQKSKIHLYSNQVFVTDDVRAIVPEFLMLLHGVIDSQDIPLNVSRSQLQNDHNVRKITSYITKKVAEKLSDLFKKDRAEYEKKWDDISVFVKYGMLTDNSFYEKANNVSLYKNIDGQYFTFEELKEKIKDKQTDKHKKLICIYSTDKKGQHSYIQSAKDNGFEVLLMDNPFIDVHFMQFMEQKETDITFVRVDSDTADNLVQTEDKKESVLSEKQQEKVKTLFTEMLKDEKNNIELKALSPEDMPVIITKPEFMRRFKDMQQFQNIGGGEMPEFYNIVINSNNPLITDKLLNMKSEEKKERFANYLYKLAKLNQNMLTGEELTDFVKTSVEFLK